MNNNSLNITIALVGQGAHCHAEYTRHNQAHPAET